MILKVVDQLGENQAHLPFVTAHQYGIVQCVLTDLAYLNEIFPQYFVLLHAGNNFAFRRTPDNDFIDVFHSGNMGNGEKAGEKGSGLPSVVFTARPFHTLPQPG